MSTTRNGALALTIGLAATLGYADAAFSQIIISPTCAPSISSTSFMAELKYATPGSTPDVLTINLAAVQPHLRSSHKQGVHPFGIKHNVLLKPPPSGPSVWLQMDPSDKSCTFTLTPDGSTSLRTWTIFPPADSNAAFHIKDTKGSEGDAYAFP